MGLKRPNSEELERMVEKFREEVQKHKQADEALSPEKKIIGDRSDKEELLLGLGLMLIEKRGLRSI